MPCSEGHISAFVVAASRSGAGKTSVAVGIMQCARFLGLVVQPYKVGPDYLDPMYHRIATGRPCRTLDTFLMSHNMVSQTFWCGAAGADVAIVEGAMGLYDGKLESGGIGSTAEVAKTLGLPVVLVLDVSGQGQTAAAVVLGMVTYDPKLRIIGVVLNRVGSVRHEASLRREIEAKTGVRVLGAVPRGALPELPQRHLGLVPVGEVGTTRELLSSLADAIGRYVDVQAILEASRQCRVGAKEAPAVKVQRATIGVARDDAFNFYYEDNLDLLRSSGARLVEFSPLSDASLPTHVQGLYLGGGYPEVFADQLARNGSMLESIRKAVDAGMPVYAECGGLMYLSRGIQDLQGKRYPMAGILDAWAVMEPARVAIGYVTAEFVTPCWLGHVGRRVRGHEYHWSRLDSVLHPPLYRVLEPRQTLDGVVTGPESNLLASYVHLHFASYPEAAERFVEACREFGSY